MAQNLPSRQRSGAPGRTDPEVFLVRLFDNFFGGPVLSGAAERQGTITAPKIDISETENEFRVRAELPGVSQGDVEVMLNDDMLTIRAEREIEQEEDREDYHLVEMSYGTLQRTLQLPYRVDPDQVQARFENGILTISLPKSQAQQRSNRIEVQGADETGGEGKVRTAGNGKGQKSQDQGQGQAQSRT
jgi:HSP20 family protein